MLSAACYAFLAFFTKREDFLPLFICYTLPFAGYLYFVVKSVDPQRLNYLLITALFFRMIFLCAQPNLSDDYYRYILDGRVILAGYSPYEYIPADLWDINPDIFQGLYDYQTQTYHFNSPDFYSVYPPVLQFIFLVSSWLGGGNIFVTMFFMKLFILASEIGILWIGYKLLGKLGLPPHRIVIYALNPVVIVELSGGIHFETYSLFFTLLSIYLLCSKKDSFAAFSFAGAIAAKIIPVIFLPMIFKFLGFKRFVSFLVIVLVVLVVSFVPLMTYKALENIMTSLKMYFGYFEFNASLHYVHYWKYEWRHVPLVLFGLAFVWLWVRLGRHDVLAFLNTIFWVLALYFVQTSTVHPWYLTVLVGLCMFTHYRFPIGWVAFLPLTYIAYLDPDHYQERAWVIITEYSVVFSMMIVESVRKTGTSKLLKIS